MARNWRLSNLSTTLAKRKRTKPRASGPKDRRRRKRPKPERQRRLQKRKKRAAARNSQGLTDEPWSAAGAGIGALCFNRREDYPAPPGAAGTEHPREQMTIGVKRAMSNQDNQRANAEASPEAP